MDKTKILSPMRDTPGIPFHGRRYVNSDIDRHTPQTDLEQRAEKINAEGDAK